MSGTEGGTRSPVRLDICMKILTRHRSLLNRSSDSFPLELMVGDRQGFKLCLRSYGGTQRIRERSSPMDYIFSTVIFTLSPFFRSSEGLNVISLSLIHISEPTRLGMISYAVFCLKKK